MNSTIKEYYYKIDRYTLEEIERIAHRLIFLSPSTDSAQYQAAEAAYKDMKKYAPYTVDKYRLLALQEEGDRLAKDDEAKKQYYAQRLTICEVLIKIAPNDAESALLYYYKGLAEQALIKEAKSAFDKSIKLLKKTQDEKEVDLYFIVKAKADALEKKGDYRKAIEWYQYLRWLYKRNEPAGYEQEISSLLGKIKDIYKALSFS